jgi:hypothetical protein
VSICNASFARSYIQDAPSNQASYPGSLPDISPDPQLNNKKFRIIRTPNLSVIREEDHCCLVCLNRLTYFSSPVLDAVKGTLHAITKRSYELAYFQQNHIISVALRLIMCIVEPNEVDRSPPSSTTEETVILLVSFPDLRAS